MANDIAGFGGLICFLIYLEWTNNKMCNRVLLVSDNFKGLMEMVGRDHYFQCSAEWGYV
jgi:hypothetical protein